VICSSHSHEEENPAIDLTQIVLEKVQAHIDEVVDITLKLADVARDEVLDREHLCAEVYEIIVPDCH